MDRLPLSMATDDFERAFVSGRLAPRGLHVRFFLVGDEIVGEWTPKADVEGWPGLAHGSMFAALHDEAAGWAMVALMGECGFTSRMEIRFLGPLRLGEPVVVRAPAGKIEGRTATFATEIRRARDNAPLSSSTTEYAIADAAMVARVTGVPVTGPFAQWLAADQKTRKMMSRAIWQQRSGMKALPADSR